MEKRSKDLCSILECIPPKLKEEISNVNTFIPHDKIAQLKDNSIIAIIENTSEILYAYKHSKNPGDETFLTGAWLDINNIYIIYLFYLFFKRHRLTREKP